MRVLGKRLLPALVAFAAAALVAGYGASVFASSSATTTSATASAPTTTTTNTASKAGTSIGNPSVGASLFQQNCATCHGQQLEGGIGPRLDPIVPIDNITHPLNAQYLINTITNGRQGEFGQMPKKGGNPSLTDQDVRDLAAFIIQQNKVNPSPPQSVQELAVSNVQWVTIGILVLLVLTYLLARYNMRWVARRSRR